MSKITFNTIKIILPRSKIYDSEKMIRNDMKKKILMLKKLSK